MGLIDSIVDRAFRDEKAGRVVVFTGGPRKRGYLVRSEPEELKIRAFLKMFYFAHLSILILGLQAATYWSTLFTRPARHVFSAMGISLGIYALVVGLPYFFLWRSYRKALLSFVAAEDEVLVSRSGARMWTATTAFVALGVLLLAAALMFLIRPRLS